MFKLQVDHNHTAALKFSKVDYEPARVVEDILVDGLQAISLTYQLPGGNLLSFDRLTADSK